MVRPGNLSDFKYLSHCFELLTCYFQIVVELHAVLEVLQKEPCTVYVVFLNEDM